MRYLELNKLTKQELKWYLESMDYGIYWKPLKTKSDLIWKIIELEKKEEEK